jgi:hypothetical protein
LDKIKHNDGFHLKEPTKWDPCFVEFIDFCLKKDPVCRPKAEHILKSNSSFFEKAKDNKYIAEYLLKGVPTVKERVRISLI